MLHKHIRGWAGFAVLGCVALGLVMSGSLVAAERVVREFRGMGQQQTEVFRVQAPWLIEWSNLPRTPVEEELAYLEIHLHRPVTNEHLGRVTSIRGIARGQMLIEESGQFHLRVRGQAAEWRVRVIDIDRATADRLQPRR